MTAIEVACFHFGIPRNTSAPMFIHAPSFLTSSIGLESYTPLVMSIVQQRLKESAGFPRKRKRSPAIAEIAFDSSAREDYLSGFHKRKLQRIKHAKEESAKRDREDKIVARKIVRWDTILCSKTS